MSGDRPEVRSLQRVFTDMGSARSDATLSLTWSVEVWTPALDDGGYSLHHSLPRCLVVIRTDIATPHGFEDATLGLPVVPRELSLIEADGPRGLWLVPSIYASDAIRAGVRAADGLRADAAAYLEAVKAADADAPASVPYDEADSRFRRLDAAGRAAITDARRVQRKEPA